MFVSLLVSFFNNLTNHLHLFPFYIFLFGGFNVLCVMSATSFLILFQQVAFPIMIECLNCSIQYTTILIILFLLDKSYCYVLIVAKLI